MLQDAWFLNSKLLYLGNKHPGQISGLPTLGVRCPL